MFPKEIKNIISSYYQSYFVHELNQDFKSRYKWQDSVNGGVWINGCRINFWPVESYSTTWRNRECFVKIRCCSFVTQQSRDYYVPARYFTTLIESDLSDSERAKMLIKSGV